MRPMQTAKNIFVFILAGLIIAPFKGYCFDYKDIDLTLRAGVSETYDDNITFLNQNEKEDYITNLSFGLTLQYAGKNRTLELAANVIQQLFVEYVDFNNTSQDLTLNYNQEFSRYDRINLSNTFSHTYEPRSFEEAFGWTSGRYSYYRNRLKIGYTKDISKQLSVGARYNNEVDEVSREDLSDSYLNGAGIDAVYFPSSAARLMFSYDFTSRDFDPGREAFTQTITPALRYYLTNQLYFDGKAGMDFISSYSDKNYARPLIQAALTSDIDENSRASISFGKRYYTNAYSEDLFDYWQASGALTKQLLKRLGCALSGFYGEGEYVGSGITDKLQGAGIDFNYDLGKNLKADLSYSYYNTDSTIETREYTKNKILIGLSAEF